MRRILLLSLLLFPSLSFAQCFQPVPCTPTPTATATVTPAPIRTINFTEDPNVIFASPGMGFQTTRKTINEVANPRGVPSTNEVFKFYAEEVNPRAGIFDWSLLDRAVSKARSAGQTLNVGIVMYDPYGGNWLRGVIPGRTYRVDQSKEETGTPNAQYFAPDFNSPATLGAHRSLLESFKTRFLGNPTIEFVDLRSIGSYGEWHNFALVDVATGSSIPMPSESASLAVIQDYQTRIPTGSGLFVLDGEFARKYGKAFAGWRADCWGGHHEDDLYPEWLTSPVDLREHWRSSPVALEPCGQMLGTQVMSLSRKVDIALARHATLINTKNSFIYTDSEWVQIKRLLTHMGYRLVVDSVTVRGLSLSIRIRNVGVAPNYKPIRIESGGKSILLSRLMPGETRILSLNTNTPPTKLLFSMEGRPVRTANVEWSEGLAL